MTLRAGVVAAVIFGSEGIGVEPGGVGVVVMSFVTFIVAVVRYWVKGCCDGGKCCVCWDRRELGTVELGRTGFDLNDAGSGENE